MPRGANALRHPDRDWVFPINWNPVASWKRCEGNYFAEDFCSGPAVRYTIAKEPRGYVSRLRERKSLSLSRFRATAALGETLSLLRQFRGNERKEERGGARVDVRARFSSKRLVFGVPRTRTLFAPRPSSWIPSRPDSLSDFSRARSPTATRGFARSPNAFRSSARPLVRRVAVFFAVPEERQIGSPLAESAPRFVFVLLSSARLIDRVAKLTLEPTRLRRGSSRYPLER